MFRVSEHVRKTTSKEGGIVLDVKHGHMFALNFVGSKILELVEQETPPSMIVQEIARIFGVNTEIADRDVRAFLEALESHRLIEIRRPNAAL